jgi:hypothetical protein
MFFFGFFECFHLRLRKRKKRRGLRWCARAYCQTAKIFSTAQPQRQAALKTSGSLERSSSDITRKLDHRRTKSDRFRSRGVAGERSSSVSGVRYLSRPTSSVFFPRCSMNVNLNMNGQQRSVDRRLNPKAEHGGPWRLLRALVARMGEGGVQGGVACLQKRSRGRRSETRDREPNAALLSVVESGRDRRCDSARMVNRTRLFTAK